MIVSDIVCDYTRSSGDRGKDPPVLIPNTEVKLTSAENTLLETAREDRLLLHPLKNGFTKSHHIAP